MDNQIAQVLPIMRTNTGSFCVLPVIRSSRYLRITVGNAHIIAVAILLEPLFKSAALCEDEILKPMMVANIPRQHISSHIFRIR